VKNDANEPQPPPQSGSAPPTWQLVINDMTERDRLGAAKYGVRHQHDNGRDHLVDAYQELLDGAVYLRAEIEKRRNERQRAAAMVRAWADRHLPKDELGNRDRLSLELLARDIEGDGRPAVVVTERMRQLARLLRVPENSAPVAELINLIEGGP
jgi:hypothetical protein